MELNKVITETRQQFSNAICRKFKFYGIQRAEFKKNQVIIIFDSNDENAVIINTRKERQESQQKPRIYK